jgi:3-dehydroquinate synthase
MRRIEVSHGARKSPIVVGDGALRIAPELLAAAGLRTPPVVVSNAAIWRLHGEALLRALGRGMQPAGIILIGDGEQHKNHATLRRIYEGLFRLRADRRSWIVAFGGGVVGDIAGFAAATFLRGTPYVNVPTTLLAQVDSAIGGKVAVNVPQGKNLIGAFHQPAAVLSDIGLLGSLPPRELASGLYEVVKAGAIRSERLVAYLERRLPGILKCEPAPLQHIVAESSRIKAEVVSGDEKEEDLRMILNYGHTVGHALEAATDYRRFKHGEGVAWGMIAALGFGLESGIMAPDQARRLARLIHRVEILPSMRGIPLERVWKALLRDKKFRSGEIRMVMLPQLGRTTIVSDIDPRKLRAFLAGFLAGKTNLL